MDSNSFMSLNNDRTSNFQKALRKMVNTCNSLNSSEQKWKYINLNPYSTTLRELIKIRRIGNPVIPIVSWKNTPAYKLSKFFSEKSAILSHYRMPSM